MGHLLNVIKLLGLTVVVLLLLCFSHLFIPSPWSNWTICIILLIVAAIFANKSYKAIAKNVELSHQTLWRKYESKPKVSIHIDEFKDEASYQVAKYVIARVSEWKLIPEDRLGANDNLDIFTKIKNWPHVVFGNYKYSALNAEYAKCRTLAEYCNYISSAKS